MGFVSEGVFAESLRNSTEFRGNLRNVFCHDPFLNDPIRLLIIDSFATCLLVFGKGKITSKTGTLFALCRGSAQILADFSEAILSTIRKTEVEPKTWTQSGLVGLRRTGLC